MWLIAPKDQRNRSRCNDLSFVDRSQSGGGSLGCSAADGGVGGGGSVIILVVCHVNPLDFIASIKRFLNCVIGLAGVKRQTLKRVVLPSASFSDMLTPNTTKSQAMSFLL